MRLLLVLLMLAVPAAAQLDYVGIRNATVIFDVSEDGSATQETSIELFREVNGSLNYTFAKPRHGIAVTDGSSALGFELAQNGTFMTISLPSPTSRIVISSEADSPAKTDSTFHFISDAGFEVDQLTVQVMLPKGFEVHDDSYAPSDAAILSDGGRVILSWERSKVGEPLTFSVQYTALGAPAGGIWFTAALAGVGIAAFIIMYFRVRTREEFVRGFREDERRTIEYIESRKVAFQSDLQREFKFSRSKATRIVAHLEQKGLVKKRRYGRTNRLEWIK